MPSLVTDGEEEVAAALRSVYEKYPKLADMNFKVIDSRAVGMEHPRNLGGGPLEFYPPDERDNPNKGYPTIELFNPDLKGKRLESALFGDMLHHLPDVNPKFNALREAFRRSMTAEQAGMDRNAFDRYVKEGEDRTFEQWFEVSRLDAYLRGKLAPDERDEWADVYTPAQNQLLMRMEEELRSGAPTVVGPSLREHADDVMILN